MSDDATRLATASPLSFMLAMAHALMDLLARQPLPSRTAHKVLCSAVQLDRALCAAHSAWPNEAAVTALVPEIKRRLRGLESRAGAAGIPLAACLQALLPEPTAIPLRLSPAALTLVGVAQLRAAIEGGPLTPRRVLQLKALLAAEAPLRRIIEAEAAGLPIPPALVEEADVASLQVEEAIGTDLGAIFAEERRAAVRISATA